MENEILLNANFKSKEFVILKSEKMFSFGIVVLPDMGGNEDRSTYYEITSERVETKDSSFFFWNTNLKNPGVKQLEWIEEGIFYAAPWTFSESKSPHTVFPVRTMLELFEEGRLPKNNFSKDITTEESNYYLVNEEEHHINRIETPSTNEVNKDNFIELAFGKEQKELNDIELIDLHNHCNEVLHDEIIK